MTGLPEDQLNRAGQSDPLLLEYDYFKHLSTIALVTIGALLTWVQSAPPGSRTLFMVSLTLVGLSATLSFGAMNTIIVHRKDGRPLRRFFRWERLIASGTFATGLGLFMSEIGKGLN